MRRGVGAEPPEPDAYRSRVEQLVAIHGPADALELAAAIRMATDVLIHGIIDANNRASNGTSQTTDGAISPCYESVAQTVNQIADRVRAQQIDGARIVGTIMARWCLSHVHPRLYLDTADIPTLVAIAYGVAVRLRVHDPVLAKQLLQSESAEEIL